MGIGLFFFELIYIYQNKNEKLFMNESIQKEIARTTFANGTLQLSDDI